MKYHMVHGEVGGVLNLWFRCAFPLRILHWNNSNGARFYDLSICCLAVLSIESEVNVQSCPMICFKKVTF